MNEYQKALDSFISYVEEQVPLLKGFAKKSREAKKLQELVDISTAKKPLDWKDENLKCVGGNPRDGSFIIGICPTCKRDVQYGMNYCLECGQALDWSEVDEEE